MRIRKKGIGYPFRLRVLMAAVFAPFAASAIGMTIAAGPEPGRRAASYQTGDNREWAKKHFPYLVRPTFAKLDLARMLPELNDPPEKIKAPFKVGEPIYFRLLITNGSEGKVSFPLAGPYVHIRPKLLKDEEVVPYRQDVEQEVRNVETQRGYGSVKYRELEPNYTFTEVVKLGDWYGPLQPGRYELAVRRRFILGGDWVDSPPIKFEVVP